MWPGAEVAVVSEQARPQALVDGLARAGIRDQRVLDAMRRVQRHLFVPDHLQRSAYEDTALPIGLGQTISQPFIVAFMTEALRVDQGHRVLEIGTGSGYQAAVLSLLAKEVDSIELEAELAATARERLGRLGYRNVNVRHGDGYLGWPGKAPFDRILVTAAPPAIPQALLDQLKPGGRLVAPVGVGVQYLQIVDKSLKGEITKRESLAVEFVPMRPGVKP